MESTEKGRITILFFVYRVLVVLLVLLGLLITVGTVYRLFFHTPELAPGGAARDASGGTLQTSGREQGETFTGIGQVRVSSGDPEPGMVVLFVSFTYYPEDKAFSEELVLRIGEFRSIIKEYLGSFSTPELRRLGEETVKSELLRRFNGILRLGQIETLYFSDYMVL